MTKEGTVRMRYRPSSPTPTFKRSFPPSDITWSPGNSSGRLAPSFSRSSNVGIIILLLTPFFTRWMTSARFGDVTMALRDVSTI